MKNRYLIICFLFLSIMGYGQSQVLPAPTPQLTVQYRLYVVQKSVADPDNFTENDLEFIEYIEIANQSRFVNSYEPSQGGANPLNHPVYEHSGIDFQRVGCVQFIQDAQNYDRLNFPGWQNIAGNFASNTISVFLINDANNTNDGVANVIGGNGNKAIFINGIKKWNNRNSNDEAFNIGAVVAHEMGHVLGLRHAWIDNGPNDNIPSSSTPTLAGDEFDDMYYSDTHLYCGASSVGCTNNFMGYNNSQRHMSPQQVDVMRNQLMTVQSGILAAETIPGERVISADETWEINEDQLINQDLRIKQGVTLTVRSCVSFTSGTKVIVERGAELILDGGHMSTKYNPGPYNATDGWEGIKAVGNPSVAQTNGGQAKVSMKYSEANNRRPRIAYASTGIGTVGENDQDNQGGAIINVDQGEFFNNSRDIYFAPYDGSSEAGNVSKISNSTFVSDWRNSSTVGRLSSCIEIEHNDGIEVLSSDFKSSQHHWSAHGVKVRNSYFDIDDCTFEHFRRGIYVEGDPQFYKKKYFIRNSEFEENSVGVEIGYLQNSNLIVYNCIFRVGNNPKGQDNHGVLTTETLASVYDSQFFREASTVPVVGVEMINSFAGVSGTPNSTSNISVSRSGFTGFDVGIRFDGQNYLSPSSNHGPTAVCNTFNSCVRAIQINSHPEDGGLSGVGAFLFFDERAANNVFTGFIERVDITNNTSKLLQYIHRNNASETPSLSGPIQLSTTERGACFSNIRDDDDDDPKGDDDNTFGGIKDGKRLKDNDASVDFTIYPNPGTGPHLNIRMKQHSKIKAYVITNARGQEVSGLQPLNGNTLELPMLQPGVYFIHFHDDTGEVISRRYIRQ